VKRYVFSVLVAVDQLGNALLGGYADETVSYRAAKARNQGKRWGCALCTVLDAIETDHCHKAIMAKWFSLKKRGVI
jgi:hypothetical protein